MGQNVAALAPIMTGQPVIPVIVIEDAGKAVPLARALAAGGLPAVEITLRTEAALDAIEAIASEVPEAVVGAGTALNAKQYEACRAAGARFVVSPGFTPELAEAADGANVPLLPGCVTSSEIMAALEEGYTHLKFFPAGQAGGVAYLKALASPFSAVRFCPTGGVSPDNAGDYLDLPNVVCVGGSWVAPKEAVASGDWDRITALAKEAAGLG
ncbi:MAG: 2-dehydro-3-deoxy-phosphogluconate aldolase [Roseitalea sp.]|jgi:2-dehydro-3-deoxyphosphogluconate aldolase/(4S)-4-hydroxy-2-oxoglutarate aldolase|nr:2-dehydro-3-deoxy-phosphogluconate aldolase [Oceaniradius stylonematis]MBO6551928.1 2-dehydro-3-deoxy-phosphogluconate aldolase [Roseitalea sp.]MBO6951692.1 2-dehydro-3-deoxy-phosphogluconate aldolase [Rhizobiaceae bacterium]RNC95858.1 MAG: 2-dehydro-3-deoxy-phosphogluconate aldolase [Oricola sp.]MBO6592462.1 2-dehydro-3-deoxy-phosphogluconate aldolase [Roseitalea sp.]MBO6598717.1 2-dehydro-3-deoxy-phosphogluconate aldolase [Roseitalea sp.]